MFALLLHAGNLEYSSNGRAIDQSWTLLNWLAKTQALAGVPLKVGQGKRPHWVESSRRHLKAPRHPGTQDLATSSAMDGCAGDRRNVLTTIKEPFSALPTRQFPTDTRALPQQTRPAPPQRRPPHAGAAPTDLQARAACRSRGDTWNA